MKGPPADWIQPDWPAPARVRAWVTSRRGGVSQGPWAACNLATHVGDDPAAVRRNREILVQRLRLPGAPAWLEQVHGTRILELPAAGGAADGAWTRRPGQVCAVLTADCLPVLVCDRAGSRVGLAHAGWRGLAAGVLDALVDAMAPASASELLAWLGPAIGPEHFEVGPEVRAAFLARDPGHAPAFRPRGGRWLADLYLLARRMLRARGLEVLGGGLCTWSDPARFYSYRRDGVTGRMASLIWLAD